MVVVPLSKPVDGSDVSDAAPSAREACPLNWVSIAAAGTLITSGALLASGKRRAGLVAAASGTALAMLDEQETVRKWWDALPAYLAEIQLFLGRAQNVMDDIAAQRERLHKVLSSNPIK